MQEHWHGVTRISDSITLERSNSGRKCRELRVTLCRLDAVFAFLEDDREGPGASGALGSGAAMHEECGGPSDGKEGQDSALKP